MQVKMIQIRDSATCISAIAIRLTPETVPESAIIDWVGYRNFVLLVDLRNKRVRYSPEVWNDRTFKTAHVYIQDNWSKVKNGSVVDVEFILGETKKPKKPHWLERAKKKKRKKR